MKDITPTKLAVAFASFAVAATLTSVFNVGPGLLGRTVENECQIIEDRNPTADEFKSCIAPD